MGISRIVFLLTIAIAMAMFVVSERNNTTKIGYQIAELQKSCSELKEKNRYLSYYIDKSKSPDIIAFKVRGMKLSLNRPEELRGTLVSGRTNPKEDTMKTMVSKNLVTQKEPATNRSSHY